MEYMVKWLKITPTALKTIANRSTDVPLPALNLNTSGFKYFWLFSDILRFFA
ncbi:unnamed protein product [Acanthoscelides obtectus]|uniref:Uncharacterized protein n=1 Tax=Acanthoscelides obtectus TaxID=200917 RepID=A0A9P0KJF7_ACAOB|nr:unnamed protein product [Acanthoscelides obtectus]CAK1653760.1 hypothetical protein AOBTE_LOCUS18353 [Acanthoscelides obtectus]